VGRREVRKNRAYWDRVSDRYQAQHAPQLNTRPLAWGVWSIPEDAVRVLGGVRGRDVLELGCGAAQWSIFLAQRGARPVGLDASPRQLQHARRLMAEAGVRVPLVLASAEAIPFGAGTFDIVLSDHGAMSFADPWRTVPEVARVLRPGGLLAFNITSPLVYLCLDAEDQVTDRLHLPYWELGRFETEESVEYQLPYGEWIRLFRRHGLVVEDLVELRPPADAVTTYDDFVPLEWARRWPAENIWKVRRV